MAEGSGLERFVRGFGANFDNWVASTLLVNHYVDKYEGTFGLEKGTELPGTGGRIFQFLNRAFSMDGVLSFLNRRDLKGASIAAARSQELSDQLARAPHVAGFLKMLLVGFFPILVFFLAAGKWKPVLWWWLTYLSICLWTPLWNLLYHVMTTLTLNLEVMESFGKLSDGVSLYTASLISSRLYQVFAVYSSYGVRGEASGTEGRRMVPSSMLAFLGFCRFLPCFACSYFSINHNTIFNNKGFQMTTDILPTAHVRFSKQQYERIIEDTIVTGKSIPWLLRTAYFKGEILPPPLDEETRRAVRRELAGIGNNLNQLARKANTWGLQNLEREIQDCINTIRILKSFLGQTYGDR